MAMLRRLVHLGSRFSTMIFLLLGTWTVGTFIFFCVTDSPYGGWGWSYRLSANLCATRIFMCTFMAPLALAMMGSIAIRTDTTTPRSVLFAGFGLVSVIAWVITSHIILGTWQERKGPRLTGAIWAWVTWLAIWQFSLLLAHMHYCYIRAKEGGYIPMTVHHQTEEESSGFYMVEDKRDEPSYSNGSSDEAVEEDDAPVTVLNEVPEEEVYRRGSLPVPHPTGSNDSPVTVMDEVADEDELYRRASFPASPVSPFHTIHLGQRGENGGSEEEYRPHDTIDASEVGRVDIRMEESIADQPYEQELIKSLPPRFRAETPVENALSRTKMAIWAICITLQIVSAAIVVFCASQVIQEGPAHAKGFIGLQSFCEHTFWLLLLAVWCSVLPDGPTIPVYPVAK